MKNLRILLLALLLAGCFEDCNKPKEEESNQIEGCSMPPVFTDTHNEYEVYRGGDFDFFKNTLLNLKETQLFNKPVSGKVEINMEAKNKVVEILKKEVTTPEEQYVKAQSIYWTLCYIEKAIEKQQIPNDSTINELKYELLRKLTGLEEEQTSPLSLKTTETKELLFEHYSYVEGVKNRMADPTIESYLKDELEIIQLNLRIIDEAQLEFNNGELSEAKLIEILDEIQLKLISSEKSIEALIDSHLEQ